VNERLLGMLLARRSSARRSWRAEFAVRGAFHGESHVLRGRREGGGQECCIGGGRAGWVPARARPSRGGELEDERDEDGGGEGAGDEPASGRVRPATVWAVPCSGLVRRGSGRAVRDGFWRAVIGGCRVLLGLERADDLLGGGRVVGGPSGRVIAVELLPGVELGERRAVHGHRVGEAEGEGAEVLVRLAG
jgi:hypothetical protein